MKRYLVTICVWALCLANWWGRPAAAESIQGRVVDAQDGRPLAGVTLVLAGTQLGTHSDAEGRFRLPALPPGPARLLVSHIGYRPKDVPVVVGEAADLSIALEVSAVELPGVVVSATRRAQLFAEAPVSMAVAQAPELQTHNSFTLSGPLTYVAGVNQVGSQVDIRGSSGYSQGTGSRVLLLLDGFPMLSADLGDIKWDAVPTEEVERVEVIKGAGSALYGTGALGGVINVITRQPSPTPQTRFRLLSGQYSQPAYRAWRWTEDPMYLAGVDLSHSRSFGPTGLIVAGGHQRTAGYEENDEFRRYHLYAKVVRPLGGTGRWTSLARWASDDHEVFLQWRDRQHPLQVPKGDEGASTLSRKLYLSSEYYQMRGPALGYKLKGYYFRTDFENSRAAGGLASVGHKLGAETQLDYTGLEHLALSLGSAATLDRVVAPGDFIGERQAYNLALYAQGTRRLPPWAEVIGGLRYDRHHRDTGSAEELLRCVVPVGRARPTQQQLSPQLGVAFFPAAHTTLRASVGRGFRAPSISEVFTQAEASGVLICPNPSLRAERSWSYEVGARQTVGRFMRVDVALFWNTFEGLVEARPDPALGEGVLAASFRNLDRARVRGLELEQQLALPGGLRWRAAYTLLDAVEFLDAQTPLPPYGGQELVAGEQAPLPYRARHLLNTGLAAERGRARGGVEFRYMSRFRRVSGLFPEGRRDLVPVYLVDLFTGWRMRELDLTLRIDNVLNYHYVLTERELRSPRRFSVGLAGAI
ncbi:MAG: TonB-dependent receptor [Candidatus Latescibacteria bacterium]|nr:TonB-dependent receptor [Candidatus Latescibacterota bacterium]